MSTDYKIGIVVGLVVLIAGVVYFLVSGEGDKTEPPPIDVKAVGSNRVVGEAEAPTPSDVTRPEEITLPLEAPPPPPATQPAAAAEAPAETPTTAPAAGLQLYEDAEDAEDVAPDETPSTTDAGVVRIRIDSDEQEQNSFQLSEDADSAWEEPDPQPAEEPVIRTIPRPTETAEVGPAGGSYVVQKGDNGFWIIAQRVYGPDKGKYWTLIQRANPTADTNALREGQTLKIPPLPAEARQDETTTETVAGIQPDDSGRAVPGTDGNRVYVVAEGEAGLWGVAEKVYGKGQLWEHIQRANPKVKPSALRPGMKLLIPPLPTTTAATRPGGATARDATATTTGTLPRRGETFTENNRRYYVVQAGDMGYWGIAKKVYGDGKYSYLIDRANAGVDSYSLQPGDKLEVPPIPASAAGRPGRPARATPPPSPPRNGEPDFGP
ncbi:MAG: LysM peptidoglycan-binding domain-containing protein [Phycisphaerae bacterium]|nr:LysM peptidoglycan-binding domain-containing protein [Phycisphaerae bacterium]